MSFLKWAFAGLLVLAVLGWWFAEAIILTGVRIAADRRTPVLSGRYGTRFGFEFTPTPPGMVQVVVS